MTTFTPLEPPSSKCPKCLGLWACVSRESCPDNKLCEQLSGDPCVVVIDEIEQLLNMRATCWAWAEPVTPCLVCGAKDCQDRRMMEEI